MTAEVLKYTLAQVEALEVAPGAEHENLEGWVPELASDEELREALAKGADRAIHLEDDRFVTLDAFTLARAFAAAIKDESFDLIFTGLQSDDFGYAQTGVLLAELLGWAHAAGFTEVAPSASVWCFATDEERGWWGGLWADRFTSSAMADQLLEHGIATRDDLGEFAAGWRRWASSPDGWFAVPHGEILATA